MDWEESTGDKILLPLEEKTADAGRPLSGPVVPGMKAECGRGGGVLEVLKIKQILVAIAAMIISSHIVLLTYLREDLGWFKIDHNP